MVIMINEACLFWDLALPGPSFACRSAWCLTATICFWAGQADPGDRVRHGTSTRSRSSQALRLRSSRDAQGCDSATAADGRLGRLEQAHNQAGRSDAWQLGARCFVRVFGNAAVASAGCPVLSHRQRNLARHATRGHNGTT